MEELWRRHQEATNDGRRPTFHIKEFRYIDIFERYLPRFGLEGPKLEAMVLDTLVEYEQRGYYKIENDLVSLTEKGMVKCNEPLHDWD